MSDSQNDNHNDHQIKDQAPPPQEKKPEEAGAAGRASPPDTGDSATLDEISPELAALEDTVPGTSALESMSPYEKGAPSAAGPGPAPAGAPLMPLPDFYNVVGVKFRRAGKTYEFDAGPLLFKIGEKIVVETDKGLGLGRVATPVRTLPRADVDPDIKRVVRKANWNDLQRDRKNKEREDEAFGYCLSRIKERNLEMKLISVDYFHDASKAIFYFTSEQRVDFRELVKDLAHQLHTRIEMKQIGVRDEAKILGGLGNCGQPLCCATFLEDFIPVSVRMAKDQSLAMNPAKVSGLCGRLMCCLAYEYQAYQEELKTLPRKGKRAMCPNGRCKIMDLNVLQRTCMVELETGGSLILPCDQIGPDDPQQAKEQQQQQKPPEAARQKPQRDNSHQRPRRDRKPKPQ